MKAATRYRCLRCDTGYPADIAIDSRGCPVCAGTAPANLEIVQHRRIATENVLASKTTPPPSLWRYADHLPCPAECSISLGEGLTPLMPAPNMGVRLGLSRLFIKDEGRNPTWSHKDRFSSVAVSFARSVGAEVVTTASSGNAGASLAAYASRAGLHCVVATFSGTAGPMLTQIRKYGATVVPFAQKADRWAFIAEAVERFGWFATSPFRAPVVGSHPAGIAGYKTLAYEIVEQLGGKAPHWCALPVCYGDALSGLWQGFEELYQTGEIVRLPRLVAAEVHGSLTAALAGDDDFVPDMEARFSTLAVSIGATRSTYQALKALRQSGGIAIPVGNDQLIELQEELARREGVFAELAATTPLAAIGLLRRRNLIAPDDSVVAVVTASGMKDIDISEPDHRHQTPFHSIADAWRSLPSDIRPGRRESGLEICETANV